MKGAKYRGSNFMGSNQVYLSLGSNHGKREEYIDNALYLLSYEMYIFLKSPYYLTEPLGCDEPAYLPNQPWFLNVAIMAKTELTPHQCLAALHHIEDELGRDRSFPKPPRTIDLDILFWNDEVIETKELIVPNPLLHERMFVLAPLNAIASEYMHPIKRRTVNELYDQLSGGGKHGKVVKLKGHGYD